MQEKERERESKVKKWIYFSPKIEDNLTFISVRVILQTLSPLTLVKENWVYRCSQSTSKLDHCKRVGVANYCAREREKKKWQLRVVESIRECLYVLLYESLYHCVSGYVCGMDKFQL